MCHEDDPLGINSSSMDAITVRHANRDCSKSNARKTDNRAFNSQTQYTNFY